jgi:hypothetical protein
MAVATSTAILGAGALAAGAGLYGSSQAARAQKSAADRAARTQTEMFNRQVELQEPFREAGLTAQNRLMTLLGLEGGEAGAADFGRYARDFGMSDFEADPGYGFRMDEGMKALERSAAARGGLLSGTTLKGIQRFGQDLASNEYQNAFNRYYAARNAQLNPLQGILGQGQSSTNVLTGAAGEAGRGIGTAQMAGGAARASGYAAGTNALTGALQSGMQGYLQYNAMRPGGYGAYAPQAGTNYGPAAYGSGVSQFDV